MKKTFTIVILSILAFLCNFEKLYAQTTLAAGDIAFTGYIAYNGGGVGSTEDAFSFVLLKNVAANTVIRFTENGFGNDGALRTAEQTLSLTFTTAASAGREIKISGVPNGTPSATYAIAGNAPVPTLSVTGNMLSLSVNGDQVIAYQSTTVGVAPYTFLSAIHMNVYLVSDVTGVATTAALWDNVASTVANTFISYIPTGLTSGTNAIWIGTQGNSSSERNNAKFNRVTAQAGGANLSTVAGVRAALNNQAYWDSEMMIGAGLVPSYTLPTGFDYLNTIAPVNLLSFTGALENNSKASLKWVVSDQYDIAKYIIEKSENGIDYTPIGTVLPNPSPYFTYNFGDVSALYNSNYYRLKIVENSSTATYSHIVKLDRFKSKKSISVLSNFVSNELVLSQIDITLINKTAFIINAEGRKLATVKFTKSTEYINVQNFPSGIYWLRTADGNALKFIKQ